MYEHKIFTLHITLTNQKNLSFLGGEGSIVISKVLESKEIFYLHPEYLDHGIQ